MAEGFTDGVRDFVREESGAMDKGSKGKGLAVNLDAAQGSTEAEGDEPMRTGAKRPAMEVENPGSPQKARGMMMVDIEMLKSLFAEQSATLLDQQRRAMEETKTELRREVRQGEERVMAEMRQNTDKISELQNQNSDIQKRLTALETRPMATSASSTAIPEGVAHTDKHKFTLIFGGWAKETKRAELLGQLHEALQRLSVAKLTDYPGFCTGPRRSLALMSFKLRGNEGYYDMRDRMNSVIRAVNSSSTSLRGGSKLWAGFSKSKAERDRGSVAALTRRVIRYLSPDAEDQLETEYASGTAWLKDTKVCSAMPPADGVAQGDLFQGFDTLEGAWIHVGELSKALHVSAGEVTKVIQELKR